MDLTLHAEFPRFIDVAFQNRAERIEFGKRLPIYHSENWRAASNGGPNADQPMLGYHTEWPQMAIFSQRAVARVGGRLFRAEVQHPGGDPTRAAMLEDFTGFVALQQSNPAAESAPAQA